MCCARPESRYPIRAAAWANVDVASAATDVRDLFARLAHSRPVRLMGVRLPAQSSRPIKLGAAALSKARSPFSSSDRTWSHEMPSSLHGSSQPACIETRLLPQSVQRRNFSAMHGRAEASDTGCQLDIMFVTELVADAVVRIRPAAVLPHPVGWNPDCPAMYFSHPCVSFCTFLAECALSDELVCPQALTFNFQGGCQSVYLVQAKCCTRVPCIQLQSRGSS